MLIYQVLGSLGLILLERSRPLSVNDFEARKSYSVGFLVFCGLSRPRTASPVPEAASARPTPSPDLAKTYVTQNRRCMRVRAYHKC